MTELHENLGPPPDLKPAVALLHFLRGRNQLQLRPAIGIQRAERRSTNRHTSKNPQPSLIHSESLTSYPPPILYAKAAGLYAQAAGGRTMKGTNASNQKIPPSASIPKTRDYFPHPSLFTT